MAFLQALTVGLLLFLGSLLVGLAGLYLYARSKDKTVGEVLREFNQFVDEDNKTALEEVMATRLASLTTMDDLSFQQYVQGVFKESPFRLEFHKGHPDIHMQAIHKLSGEILPVWCKSQEEAVGLEELQRFNEAIDSINARGGMFITPSSFTQEAQEWLRSREHIRAIDGSSLMEIFRKTVTV